MNDTKLQLEAGEFYRTRCGLKAVVLAKNPFNENGQKKCEDFIGAIEFPDQGSGEEATSWSSAGQFELDGSEPGYDLVALWEAGL